MRPPQPPAPIARLRERLIRSPDDGNAWLELAQVLARSGGSSELYHALEQAIRSMPENEEAWRLAAEVHRRERGIDAAVRWLAHAARQNPDFAAPRRVLVALRDDARSAAAWSEGDAARAAGRWSAALESYREAERAKPDSPQLLTNIGCCLASLDRHAEAAGCFERALELEPQLAEARLNLALLRVYQSRYAEAEKAIDDVLARASLDSGGLERAEVLRDIVREHGRLQPHIVDAVENGRVKRLQAELEAAPARISQPSETFVDTLRSLAGRCAGLAIGDETFRYRSDTRALPLLEACVQSNLPGGADAIAEVAEQLRAKPETRDDERNLGRVRQFLRLGRDRRHHRSESLEGPDGEAWLRYWHARLLEDQPEKLPGQYKLVANTLNGLPLAPPEHVSGTFRVLLRDILPTVPTGAARAMFLLLSINVVHGFSDGNGRLGRFLLAWETESSGLPALLLPLAAREMAARAYDIAQLEGEPGPFFDVVREAHHMTDALLGELDRIGVPPADRLLL